MAHITRLNLLGLDLLAIIILEGFNLDMNQLENPHKRSIEWWCKWKNQKVEFGSDWLIEKTKYKVAYKFLW